MTARVAGIACAAICAVFVAPAVASARQAATSFEQLKMVGNSGEKVAVVSPPVPVIEVGAAVRREADRLATVDSFERAAASQSRADRWKCRAKWAVIGGAAGAVITTVSVREGNGGFGPSRGTLISLGALAGAVGGLILAPTC